MLKAESVPGSSPPRPRRPLFGFTHVSRVKREVDERMGRGPFLRDLVRVRSWRDMADSPVDGVVVATPPGSHEEICSFLLSRGKPVMVEKPMTPDLGSALRLEKAVRKAGVPFLVNHVHLFSPYYERLRKLSAGGLGASVIFSRGRGCGPFRSYSSLLDYGPHDLSMCLGLGLGRPVLESRRTLPDGRGSVTVLEIRFRSSGLSSRAFVQIGNGARDLSEKERWFEVVSDGQRLVYDDTVHHPKLFRNGKPVRVQFRLPLDCAVTAFATAVKTGWMDWRFGTKIPVAVARLIEEASRP